MNIFNIIDLIFRQYAIIPLCILLGVIVWINLKNKKFQKIILSKSNEEESLWKQKWEELEKNKTNLIEQRVEETNGRWQKKYNKLSKEVLELRGSLKKKEATILQLKKDAQTLKNSYTQKNEDNLNL